MLAPATPLRGAGRRGRKWPVRAAGSRNESRPNQMCEPAAGAGSPVRTAGARYACRPDNRKSWAVAVAQIWALFPDRRPATDPYPVRSGAYGITWNFMGVNGFLTMLIPISWGLAGHAAAKAHFLRTRFGQFPAKFGRPNAIRSDCIQTGSARNRPTPPKRKRAGASFPRLRPLSTSRPVSRVLSGELPLRDGHSSGTRIAVRL